MFPLETSIFKLIVLAASNHIRPNLGRHSHRVDTLPSRIIFMLAQKCPFSNDRDYKAYFNFRNPLVTPWVTMSSEKLCKEKADFCWYGYYIGSNQIYLGKQILKTMGFVFFVCVRACGYACVCARAHARKHMKSIDRQIAGTSSLFPTHGSWKPNSGHQTWCQARLPSEASCHPRRWIWWHCLWNLS